MKCKVKECDRCGYFGEMIETLHCFLCKACRVIVQFKVEDTNATDG